MEYPSPAAATYWLIQGRTLFAALYLLGMFCFCWIIARRLQPVLRAQSDPRFDQPLARLRNVLQYWLLQWKHPRYPLAGTLHLLIFAGFLILAVRAFAMLILGVSESFVPPGGPVYDVVRAYAATVVFAAMIFAIVRRTVFRAARYHVPAKFGKGRPGDAIFLLALIAILMLADGIAEGSRAAAGAVHVPTVSLGWTLQHSFASLSAGTLTDLYLGAFLLHAVTFFFLLCYRPFGIQFHVETSLFSIYFAKLDREVLKPVRWDVAEGDLDQVKSFGVKTFEDFTWKHMLDFYSCADCGRCSDQCPSNAVGRALSPRFLTIKARDYSFWHYPVFGGDRSLWSRLGNAGSRFGRRHGSHEQVPLPNGRGSVDVSAGSEDSRSLWSRLGNAGSRFGRRHGSHEQVPLPDGRGPVDVSAGSEDNRSLWSRLGKEASPVGKEASPVGNAAVIPVVGTLYSEDEIWSCTTCGACERECPLLVEYIDKIVDLRRGLVDDGRVPQSLQKPLKALESRGNPYGKLERKRADWAKGAVPVLNGNSTKANTLYFVDSITSYDDRIQAIGRATASVLTEAGVNFGILGAGEKDSGHDVRRFGEETLFQALREHNTEAIRDSGVQSIVTSDPHAFNALRHDYRDMPPVEHISQVLAREVRSGKVQFEAVENTNEVYAYHDPCYLGRHNDVYDDPRFVLDSIPGLKRVEMSRCRDRSFCCGGGGLALFNEVPEEERMGVRRVRMAAEAGANVIVTACPFCMVNIEDAIKVAGMEGKMAAIDLAELAEKQMVRQAAQPAVPTTGGVN